MPSASASMSEWIWFGIGMLAQGLFALRMVAQWVVSEREGRSVVPPIYWYLSVAGCVLLLAYAIYKVDVVFIFGQSLPLALYMRNIVLLIKESQQNREKEQLLLRQQAASGPVVAGADSREELDPERRSLELNRGMAATAGGRSAECQCPCQCGASERAPVSRPAPERRAA